MKDDIAKAEALDAAWRLIRTAQIACLRMGLNDRGGDLSLSHEVRIFAQEFGDGGKAWPVLCALKEIDRG